MGRYDHIVEVRKYNENHDNLGRFTSASGGSAGSSYQKLSHTDAIAMATEMGQDEMTRQDFKKITDTLTGYLGTINSFTINEALREGTEMDAATKETVAAMDRNMRASTRDIQLHRMIGGSLLRALGVADVDLNAEDADEKLKQAVGKVYANPGYTSTSFDMADNMFKTNQVTMHINAPKGTKMLVSPKRKDFWGQNKADKIAEAEIVLARNTAMVVRSIRVTEPAKGARRAKVEVYLDVLQR